MAVDELRIDFRVTEWDVRDGITQMWFVGAHADVGGGYPPSESRLSDVALEWIMPNLSELGIKFMGSLVCTPDAQGGRGGRLVCRRLRFGDRELQFHAGGGNLTTTRISIIE